MILKRLEYTQKIVRNADISSLLLRITPAEVEDLAKYLYIINGSLITKNTQSRKIVHFIDSVSVGNMREALRMFNNFIVSGNTNVDEIFEKHAQSGSYQIAYHQFVKSIMLGEYRYYLQNRSHIMNVFDLDTSLTDSHFNLLRLLRYLAERTNKRSVIGRGYVEIAELIVVASGVFIKKEVVIDSLLRLSYYNLVEYDNQSKTQIDSATYVKITPSGKYYLTNLKQEFVYLDSVFVDTPVSDRATFDYVRNFSNSTDLEKRLSRTRKFVDYLYNSENEEFREHPEYLSNEFTNKKFAKDVASAFGGIEKEIRIKNKLPLT
jgi:nitrate reductase NapAB chaperone NapD